jgi:hypothetical protein
MKDTYQKEAERAEVSIKDTNHPTDFDWRT